MKYILRKSKRVNNVLELRVLIITRRFCCMFVLEVTLHEFEVAETNEAIRLKVHKFVVNY